MTPVSHRNSGWIHFGSILFLLLVSVIGLVENNAFAAEPRTPEDGGEILAKLNTSSFDNNLEINQLRRALKESPTNVKRATQLAKAYIGIARENTDVRYYGYAQTALTPWWKENNPPIEVLLLRATLNQQKHQYTKATDDLKRLLKQQPRHMQAWLTLSIIQQVRGDYQSALASCAALSRTTASTWLSTLCYSQVLGLTGSAEKAYKTQQVLLMQFQLGRKELYQWVLGISAETALRLGNNQQAERAFRKALALPLRDAYLLRIFADYLLDENRLEEVVKLLKEEEQDSALLLRLAIAAKKSQKDQLIQKYQSLLLARFEAARLRGSKLHERDEALYLLEFDGDLDKALKLARDNWEIQKEPDDALILLRLALATKSSADVQIIRDWIIKTKLQDVRIEKLLKGREDV